MPIKRRVTRAIDTMVKPSWISLAVKNCHVYDLAVSIFGRFEICCFTIWPQERDLFRLEIGQEAADEQVFVGGFFDFGRRQSAPSEADDTALGICI